MKAYTDLEQSKKLAEILPIESADMEYMFLKENNSKVSNIAFVKDDDEPEWPNDSAYYFIPCWSLAALLGVLPYPSLHKTFAGWRCDSYDKEGKTCKLGENTDNPVDACYEMIIKLHELKML